MADTRTKTAPRLLASAQRRIDSELTREQVRAIRERIVFSCDQPDRNRMLTVLAQIVPLCGVVKVPTYTGEIARQIQDTIAKFIVSMTENPPLMMRSTVVTPNSVHEMQRELVAVRDAKFARMVISVLTDIGALNGIMNGSPELPLEGVSVYMAGQLSPTPIDLTLDAAHKAKAYNLHGVVCDASTIEKARCLSPRILATNVTLVGDRARVAFIDAVARGADEVAVGLELTRADDPLGLLIQHAQLLTPS